MTDDIQCYCCGKLMLPSYYARYSNAIDAELTPPEALDDLKPILERLCCRRMILMRTTLVEDFHYLQTRYEKPIVPVASCPKSFLLEVKCEHEHFHRPATSSYYVFRPYDIMYAFIRRAFINLLAQHPRQTALTLELINPLLPGKLDNKTAQWELVKAIRTTLKTNDYAFAKQFSCACNAFAYATSGAIVPATSTTNSAELEHIVIEMRGTCVFYDLLKSWKLRQMLCTQHEQHCTICGVGIIKGLNARCQKCLSKEPENDAEWGDMHHLNPLGRRLLLLRHRQFSKPNNTCEISRGRSGSDGIIS